MSRDYYYLCVVKLLKYTVMDEQEKEKASEIDARLDANYDWYIANQEELVKKYNGKQLLIVDRKVAGAYDKRIDAYVDGANNYGFGNFSLQRCSPGERDTVLRLYGPCFRINATTAICS
jgi:hypothetical protein